MKILEKARKCMSDLIDKAYLLYTTNGETTGRDAAMDIQYFVAEGMKKAGWSVHSSNVLDTAKDLGFPVVGGQIYPLDY